MTAHNEHVMIFLAHVTGVCDIKTETSRIFIMKYCLWAFNNNEKCRQRFNKTIACLYYYNYKLHASTIYNI